MRKAVIEFGPLLVFIIIIFIVSLVVWFGGFNFFLKVLGNFWDSIINLF